MTRQFRRDGVINDRLAIDDLRQMPDPAGHRPLKSHGEPLGVTHDDRPVKAGLAVDEALAPIQSRTDDVDALLWM